MWFEKVSISCENVSVFVVLNMFVNVNLSKFVFIYSDYVCL